MSDSNQVPESPADVRPLGQQSISYLAALIGERDAASERIQQLNAQIGGFVAAIHEAMGLDASWSMKDVSVGFVKRESGSPQ